MLLKEQISKDFFNKTFNECTEEEKENVNAQLDLLH